MAETEAEALKVRLPELDSDSEKEQDVVKSNLKGEGSLKQLFKQIVKNANQDRIDLKEYGGLMDISKKQQSKSTKVIADGLNVSNQKQSLD